MNVREAFQPVYSSLDSMWKSKRGNVTKEVNDNAIFTSQVQQYLLTGTWPCHWLSYSLTKWVSLNIAKFLQSLSLSQRMSANWVTNGHIMSNYFDSYFLSLISLVWSHETLSRVEWAVTVQWRKFISEAYRHYWLVSLIMIRIPFLIHLSVQFL